ncbi:MAG: hypothetical protein JJE44_08365 [Flavobacteriaceae bacterium]|nr:hypothetical protein [Flavobacteriaceae bacterium]
MKIVNNTLKTIAKRAIVFSCTNNTESSKEEEDLAELTALQEDMQLLIDSGICSENSGCDNIAFGSKTCGGPKAFLVYSTSIDTLLLQQKVATYNALENAYNKKWDIISDCSSVSPPNEVTCINGKCTAVY